MPCPAMRGDCSEPAGLPPTFSPPCLLSLVLTLAHSLCPSGASHSHTLVFFHIFRGFVLICSGLSTAIFLLQCFRVTVFSLAWFIFPPSGILDLVLALQFSAPCICLGVFTPVLSCYACQGEVVSVTAISWSSPVWLCLSTR